MESLGLKREDSDCRKLVSGLLAEWIATLATEVWQLANLSSVEVIAAKSVSNHLGKEKIELNDESQFQRMFCKSSNT